MYYFLAHFPQIDYSEIDNLRKKYDPNYAFVKPHIAVFFPVDASIGEQNIIAHIESVLKSSKPFPISMKGVQKSWDHYLYLTVESGKEQITTLHDNLYTGVLSPYLIKSVPYIPHITLGFFADRQAKFDRSDMEEVVFNEARFNEAVLDARSLNMNFQTIFNNVTLISREDKQSSALVVKQFLL